MATLKSLEKAVAEVGGKLGDYSENWVEVSGADFWNTRYGWIRANEERDGSYSASVSRDYAHRKGGVTGVVGRNRDKIAFSAGVRTYDTPAAAVRAYFK